MKLKSVTLLLSILNTEVVAQSLRLSSSSNTAGAGCTCQSDGDCQKAVCSIDAYTKVGTCGGGSKSPFTQVSNFVFGGGGTSMSTGSCASCQSDNDCQTQVCALNSYTKVGNCVSRDPSLPASTLAPTPLPTKLPTNLPTKTPIYGAAKVPTPAPTRVPTKVPAYAQTKAPTTTPTKDPTKSPTKTPTKVPVYTQTKSPTKVPVYTQTKAPTKVPAYTQTKAPTKVPGYSQTKAPTDGSSTKDATMMPVNNNNCCLAPHSVPTTCEVNTLIDLLDIAISSDHKLAAQWLRLSFHDAATFDVATDEGGANGCLMNELSFRAEPENGFFDIPINALTVIKNTWEGHPGTCIATSAADIIQFAGLFASLRQVPPAGIDPTKRDKLMQFEWGRPDELACQVHWIDNLPGFRDTSSDLTYDLPLRCLNAGGEIKAKMMERNGFTAEESAALIGAHTIGLSRNSFDRSNPWVKNGADDATPSGPVFDNGYHDFLANTIVAKKATDFSSIHKPFDTVFPDWYLDTNNNLSYLDTDVALAFPSQNEDIHPSFHTFTNAFAADNSLFLGTFFRSLDKMSKLGVHELLSVPTECSPCNATVSDPSSNVAVVVDLVSDLGSAKASGEKDLMLRKESDVFKTLFDHDTVPLIQNGGFTKQIFQSGSSTKGGFFSN